jgi:hypothetical protein
MTNRRGAALDRTQGISRYLSRRVYGHIFLETGGSRERPNAWFVSWACVKSNNRIGRWEKHRAGSFPGAACLTQCFGLPRTGRNMRGPWSRAKAAPLQSACSGQAVHSWCSPRVKLGGSLAGNDSSRDSSTSSSRCRSLSSISSSGRFALMVSDQLILIFSGCKNHTQQLDDILI